MTPRPATPGTGVSSTPKAKTVAVFAVALALSGAADAQTLYKCVGPDGRVLYQDAKCPERQRQSTVKPPAPPAERAAPPGGAGAENAAAAATGEPPIDMARFVALVSHYENCAATVPGFAGRHQGAYEGWRQRHAGLVARYHQDGEAQRRVRESLEYVRTRLAGRGPEDRASDAEQCDRIAASAYPAPAAAASPGRASR